MKSPYTKNDLRFPQEKENAGLVISGNSQNGIERPVMLVGDAARTGRADYSPLFGIILSWEGGGVKSVFALSFRQFARSIAECAVLEHPLAVRAAVQRERVPFCLVAPRAFAKVRIAYDGDHVTDRQAVVLHVVL